MSNTLGTDFCVEALEEVLERYGTPGIFNTDHGGQFTAEALTDVLKSDGLEIGMDGKGRWIDNMFVDRLWRSVKYEDIYLRAFEIPATLRAGLERTSGSTLGALGTLRSTDARPTMRTMIGPP